MLRTGSPTKAKRRGSGVAALLLSVLLSLGVVMGEGALGGVASAATSGPPVSTRAVQPAAPSPKGIDYSQIFRNPQVILTGADGNRLLHGSTMKVRWDLVVPADGKDGDQYVLEITEPFYFTPVRTAGELKDGQGRVFATYQSTDPLVGYPTGLDKKMVVTLTEEAASHGDIQGFIEFQIGRVQAAEEVTKPLEIKVGGQEIGPGGTYTILPFSTYKNTVLFQGSVINQNHPGVSAVSIALGDSINYSTYEFKVTPETPGLTPMCRCRAVPVYNADLGGQLDYSSAVDLDVTTCDPETGNTVCKFPAGVTMDTSRHYAWRIPTSFIADEANKEYTTRIETTDPTFDVVRTATSGHPPTLGVDIPTIDVSKAIKEKGSLYVGQQVTYTIKAVADEANIRPAFDVALSDTLPEGLKFVSASGAGKHSGGNDNGGGVVSWPSEPFLRAGQQTERTVIAEVVGLGRDGEVKNTAKAAGKNVCDGIDGYSTCTANVTSKVDKTSFDFKKQAKVADTNRNGWLGDAGDTIHYSFQVTNTGKGPIESVLIDDDLLGISGHECLEAPLPPSSQVQCSGDFTHEITEAEAEAGRVENVATAQAPGSDEQTDRTETDTAAPSFDFTKQVTSIKDEDGKEVSGKNASRGDQITYGFTVENTGNVPLDKVLLTDSLLGVSNEACLAAGTVLQPGEKTACAPKPSYKYTVTDKDVKAGSVKNVAVAEVPGIPSEESKTTTKVDPPNVTTTLPKTGASGSTIWLFLGSLIALGAGAAIHENQRKTKTRTTK